MTDNPVAINRPITDEERTLMAHLAAAVIAKQTNTTIEIAADALKNYEGEIHLSGNNIDCYMTLDGKVLVHVTREFLAFYASNPDEVIDLDKYAVVIDSDTEEDDQ